MATAATFQGFDGLAATLGLSRGPREARARLVGLEKVLEGAIRLPGNQRVGLDAFIGFVPVVGDLLSAAIGAYLVWEARNLGLSKWKLWRMGANVAFDTAIGAVPSGRVVRRAGARAGDFIVVSGTIGDAALGLRLRLGTINGAPAGEGVVPSNDVDKA